MRTDGEPIGLATKSSYDVSTLAANATPPPTISSAATTTAATSAFDRFFGTNGIGSGWKTARYAAAAGSSGGGGPRRVPDRRFESIREPDSCGGVGGASPPNRGVGAANGAATAGLDSALSAPCSPSPPGKKWPGLGAGLSAIMSPLLPSTGLRRFHPHANLAGDTPCPGPTQDAKPSTGVRDTALQLLTSFRYPSRPRTYSQ